MNTKLQEQIPHSTPQQKPRVLDLIRNTCRVKNYSSKTADAYCDWVKRYSFYFHKRPLSKMGTREVEQFLTHLATDHNVAASTQNQALNALIFLYKHVIPKEIGKLDAVRAKKPKRLPEVFTVSEVRSILVELYGVEWLMGSLLYGCGLRLNECLALRVKDIDFERSIVMVRDGKGGKDRIVPLPKVVADPLRNHLTTLAEMHRSDVAKGVGVSLPGALAKKYPNAPFAWGWYYIFPARKACITPPWATPEKPLRHSLHETVLQKAVKAAIRKSGVVKHGGCHTFRHSFATHLLQAGYNVLQVKELLGHSLVQTTMGYLHLMDTGCNIQSPMDKI